MAAELDKYEIGELMERVGYDPDGSSSLDEEELSEAYLEMGGGDEVDLREFEAWWIRQPQATRALLQYKYFTFEQVAAKHSFTPVNKYSANVLHTLIATPPAAQVLEAVATPFSPFNWLLAMPDPAQPTLFKAGNGSLPQVGCGVFRIQCAMQNGD